MLNQTVGELVQVSGRACLRTAVGKAGHAVFGPYEVYEAGSYLLVYRIAIEDKGGLQPSDISLVLDATTHDGRVTLARREVAVRELGPTLDAIVLNVNLTTAEKVEWRAYTNGETALLVQDEPLVVRLGEAEPVPDLTGPLTGSDFGRMPQPTVLAIFREEFRRLYERGANLRLGEEDVTLEFQGRSVTVAGYDDMRDRPPELWDGGIHLDISHAQYREDMILRNALRDVSRDAGFYIDVGANDPDEDSVTKFFYDRGWRGINVEPSPEWYRRLVERRPRDVNLQVASSSRAGEVMFHNIVGEQLGTLVDRYADAYEQEGKARESYAVKAVTLAEICREHAPDAIHFLKIDVEGHERDVLLGMDFAHYRPWILVIEATEPNLLFNYTFGEWNQLVLDAGYRFALMDGPNRYYVAAEHAGLVERLREPLPGYVSEKTLRTLAGRH